MAGKRLSPIFTENFAENVDAIRDFLGENGRAAFARLLDRLFDDLLPMLCRFPQSGRAFFDHPSRSLETRAFRRRLRRLMHPGDELREFIVDEYLILYLIRGNQAIFLSIKHHRQLSFDLHRFWP
ncbi:MAG TPA: type II toxin-antitoxin system RelE/ParE family toxin [Candidatus Methylomirabilis sp.]|nr:type II toxin-antitoxin system RelE/ParE family toxin [Candidatus Methylomirabilis sp.]